MENLDERHGTFAEAAKQTIESACDINGLIELLEFEIERVTEQQKQPGWTNWALAAAAAALLWTALTVVAESPTLSLAAIAYLLLTFGIAYDFVRVLGAVVTPEVAVSPGSRFRLASDLIGRSRARVLFQIARFTGLGLIGGFLLDARVPWSKWATLVYCGVMAVISVGTVVMSFADMPVSISPTPPLSLRLIGGACVGLVLGVALFGLVSQLTVSALPSIAEWKLAGICFALTLVADVSFSTKQHAPLLHALVDLRRKLALGQIDCDDARRQYQITIHGLAVEHLLQQHIDTILSKLRDCVSEYKTARSQVAALKNQFERNPQTPTEEKMSLLDAIQKSVTQRQESAQKEIEAADQEVDELAKRIRSLRRTSADAGPDIQQVLAGVQAAAASTKEEVKTQSDGIRELLRSMAEQERAANQDRRSAVAATSNG